MDDAEDSMTPSDFDDATASFDQNEMTYNLKAGKNASKTQYVKIFESDWINDQPPAHQYCFNEILAVPTGIENDGNEDGS
jgi:hypothetical protein